MIGSHDVTLPKDQQPEFPDRCVACGTPSPDSFYQAVTYAVSWWNFWWIGIGKRSTVQVPACASCCRVMYLKRRVRLGIRGVSMVLAVVGAVYLLQWYQGPFKKQIGMGVGLFLMLPVIIWEVFNPPHFDMTVESKTVDYEFLDRAYADEFVALNLPPDDEENQQDEDEET